ncbi:GRAM domain protein (macronuclear) [Tetrahymena thermophila SB210]|uniref:GRAM domain protein n=1 Tax=Tetrahymena thermophila (strain SB210) TaxID=312017 RepID=I7M7X5_TETTS|nr:GRAM domain protein [Tetrahymena thermophila SB210]EAR96189.2 GRAM domain protein [Tetrahymena thermophila SB210]|eukprot:XP_001016434.2 GRAM domain protein [Tetrahymena thermophila SB210]
MSSQPQGQSSNLQNNDDDILTFSSGNNLNNMVSSNTLSQQISQQDSNQQQNEIKQKIKRIQQNWSDKCSSLEGLVELSRKASRNINNYLGSIENETEQFSKNLLKSSKSLVGGITWSQGKEFAKMTIQFGGAIQELATKSLEISQLNQLTLSKSLGEYTEQISQQKKQMQEKSQLIVKNISYMQEKYVKQYVKYVKCCKEVESAIQEQKNAQEDIRLYYNVAYTMKQDMKIKELAKEAEKEEQKVQQAIEEGNFQIENLPKLIQENYKQVKEIFKQTLHKIIDSVVAIHSQQNNLFQTFNQYIVDKKLNDDLIAIVDDDQKVIQERLFKKNPDTIPPGVNFMPIQSALARKEDVNENSIRAYPEAAFQYLEVFEVMMQERKDLMKQVKDFFGDMVDLYGNLYSQIENQSKEIKKVLTGSKGDSIIDLLYAILQDLIDQQQKNLDHIKTIFNLLKASNKTITSCISDQQSQSNGFFNMTKKLFNDFGKATNKKKWVVDTSSFLGISLDTLNQHEKKRIVLIKEQIQQLLKQIGSFLENSTKQSQEQQNELNQKKEHLDEEILQVFTSYSKIFENPVINQDGIVYEYQKQFKISSQLQKQLDEISNKQYIYNQIDQLTSSNVSSQDKETTQNGGDNSPKSSKGSSDSQNVTNSNTKEGKDDLTNSMNASVSGSSKKETKFTLLFGLTENEQPIDTFNCAFSHKILLQGKMYIFADRIGFHSYFNSQSFVGDTALSIPYIDIIRIDKRKNALIFDNSIAVITQRGELFFTSYVQRDNCYKLITYLMQAVKEGRTSMVLSAKRVLENSGASNEQIEENRKLSDVSSNGGQQTQSSPTQFTINKEVDEVQEIVLNSNQKVIEPTELSANAGTIEQSNLEENSVEDKNVAAVESKVTSQNVERKQSNTEKEISEVNKVASLVEQPRSGVDKIPPVIEKEISNNLNKSAASNSKAPSLNVSAANSPKSQKSVSNFSQQIDPLSSGVIRDFTSQQTLGLPIVQSTVIEDDSWIQQRKNIFKQQSIFEKAQNVSEFEIKFPNATPREIFNILFGLKPYKPQPEGSQEFPNFRFYIFQEFQKDTDIQFQTFNPPPPEWYTNLDCSDKDTVKSSPEISNLEFKVVHPVREKIPFGPKVSYCQNKEKYFWISAEEFIIEREIFLSKIPYCDYFTIRFQYNISQVQDQTRILIKLYVHFMKSTTFKGRIENGSLSENTEVINTVFTPQAQIAIQNYQKFEKVQRLQRLKQEAEQNSQQLTFKQSQTLTASFGESQQMDFIERQNSQLIQNQQKIEERRKRFKEQSLFTNAEKTSDFELLVPEAHPREIFNLIFFDSKYKPENSDKTYPHYLYYFMEEFQKDVDMHFGKFSPPPPEWYANLESVDCNSVLNSEDYSLREYKYVHPVREKIPFGPKVSHCQNKEKYYWISEDEFIMEKEVYLSKIPYCDYFTVRFQYSFTKNENQGTKIICRIYVNFMKSTTFKGRIESGSLSENTDVWKNAFSPQILQVMQQYIQKNGEKRKQIQEQLLQSIRLSAVQSLKSEDSSIQNQNTNKKSPPIKKSKRDIIIEQQNQITSLYKLNEERFKSLNKRLHDMQGIIDHQNNQFKNILIVIIIILIINLIHLFK